jgi:hypothetical protein
MERARLRRQALDWLRADLEVWGGLLDSEPDKTRPVLVQQMRHWLEDPDFAGVHGLLAQLPEAEWEPWQDLWEEAAATEATARVRDTAPGAPAVPKNKVLNPCRVTAATLQADPDNYNGPLPVRIEFRGQITADGPGRVRYIFLRSDGSVGPIFTLSFDKAGVKDVSTWWALPVKYEGWQALKVLGANKVVSEKARFKIESTK